MCIRTQVLPCAVVQQRLPARLRRSRRCMSVETSARALWIQGRGFRPGLQTGRGFSTKLHIEGGDYVRVFIKRRGFTAPLYTERGGASAQPWKHHYSWISGGCAESRLRLTTALHTNTHHRGSCTPVGTRYATEMQSYKAIGLRRHYFKTKSDCSACQ